MSQTITQLANQTKLANNLHLGEQALHERPSVKDPFTHKVQFTIFDRIKVY